MKVSFALGLFFDYHFFARDNRRVKRRHAILLASMTACASSVDTQELNQYPLRAEDTADTGQDVSYMGPRRDFDQDRATHEKRYCLDTDGDGAIKVDEAGEPVVEIVYHHVATTRKELVPCFPEDIGNGLLEAMGLYDDFKKENPEANYADFEAAYRKPSDCNDDDSSIHPGAEELRANGVDENCDGEDAPEIIRFLKDEDFDGFHDPDAQAIEIECDGSFSQAAECITHSKRGFVLEEESFGEDCNDSDFQVNPDAPERVGEFGDENCDGLSECYQDADGDGVAIDTIVYSEDPDCDDPGESYILSQSPDCDDNEPLAKPGNSEVPHNGIDDDCDNEVDEWACTVSFTTELSYRSSIGMYVRIFDDEGYSVDFTYGRTPQNPGVPYRAEQAWLAPLMDISDSPAFHHFSTDGASIAGVELKFPALNLARNLGDVIPAFDPNVEVPPLQLPLAACNPGQGGATSGLFCEPMDIDRTVVCHFSLPTE